MIILATCIAVAIIILNGLIGPKRTNSSKQIPFECGNKPAEEGRRRFDVKFYLVALFFIIFDVEVLFLFPWAVLYKGQLAAGNGVLFFSEMVLFLGLLTLGLVYIWKRGALKWE
jgi:NADH-quinone oxidoreductase subunit A